MCGIIGYTGSLNVRSILIAGLKKLEYRGYDSAGMALYSDHEFLLARAVGQVSELEKAVSNIKDNGETQGIAHTRWATHGAPSETNAHPHLTGSIVLVHNGIIENHAQLKERLVAQGVSFSSQTDTEVFAWLLEKEKLHLIQSTNLNFEKLSVSEKLKLLREAAMLASKKVEGHFSVMFMDRQVPEYLFAIQEGAPLVVAKTASGSFLASDIQALLHHSQDLAFVPVNSYLEIGPADIFSYSLSDGKSFALTYEKVKWSAEQVEKDGYEHFMLKEIFQQPSVVADTLSGRLPRDASEEVIWDDLDKHKVFWRGAERLVLVACGTAYYAAMTAKYWFEKWAKIPVDVDLASEFRYREPVFSKGTVLGVISQSGETADTLSVLRMANALKVPTFSICNVPGSTISRESSMLYPTKAGPEIGVASTKAFTTQLTALCLLAADLALMREKKIQFPQLARLPHELSRILDHADEYRKIGAELSSMKTVLFVGRGQMFPIALEGALKLKEITYRHAEGYAAGELKHGPIALVDKNLACVVLAPTDGLFLKTLSNVEEVRSRGGYIIGMGEENETRFSSLCSRYIPMPKCDDALAPILYVLPLQLIAYGLAKALECNIDKPRNLAKSVTVE